MTKPIPDGCEGIIPHLVVDPCVDAIAFYKKAFNAEETLRHPAPDGERIMHAEVRIAGKPVYLADDFPEMCGGTSRSPKALGASPVVIHQYVEDVDSVMQQAESAGATVIMPAQDMFWGDRYGTVADPFGHWWSFATHIKDVTPDEMAEAAAKAFS